MDKSADAFRTISEVAADLALPQHVLRFWETRFPQIRPLKRAGGRRFYRPGDIGLLRSIRHLLYDEGYTIKGVQRLLKEQGARGLVPPDPGSSPTTVETFDASADAEAHPADADVASPDGPPAFAADDIAAVREALASIEECERILGALLPAR